MVKYNMAKDEPMLTSEVVLGMLKVDSAGRVFIPKNCRTILGINGGDDIALTCNAEATSIFLKIQRNSKIVKIWRLVEERPSS